MIDDGHGSSTVGGQVHDGATINADMLSFWIEQNG